MKNVKSNFFLGSTLLFALDDLDLATDVMDALSSRSADLVPTEPLVVIVCSISVAGWQGSRLRGMYRLDT